MTRNKILQNEPKKRNPTYLQVPPHSEEATQDYALFQGAAETNKTEKRHTFAPDRNKKYVRMFFFLQFFSTFLGVSR
jgi:hypothetical protein